MKDLQVRNRQRARRIDTRVLREITLCLLDDILAIESYAVMVHLVSAATSAELNHRYLGHEGPTDVITFDFREDYDADSARLDLAGEIYICVSEAERQAREFGTTFPSEIVRYVVHGILHLLGYDDLTPAKRKIMKRAENRLLRDLSTNAPVQMGRTGAPACSGGRPPAEKTARTPTVLVRSRGGRENH